MLTDYSIAASVTHPGAPQSAALEEPRGQSGIIPLPWGTIVKQTWPKKIWIVRHGESAGNVARDAADRAGFTRIDIAARDVDVPLSSLGHEQSQALGHWFAQLSPDVRPNVVISSPY